MLTQEREATQRLVTVRMYDYGQSRAIEGGCSPDPQSRPFGVSQCHSELNQKLSQSSGNQYPSQGDKLSPLFPPALTLPLWSPLPKANRELIYRETWESGSQVKTCQGGRRDGFEDKETHKPCTLQNWPR